MVGEVRLGREDCVDRDVVGLGEDSEGKYTVRMCN